MLVRCLSLRILPAPPLLLFCALPSHLGLQPFRSAVCGTQAFAEFLSQRCVATAWADPEVLLFDAIVEARAAGRPARLLSDARFNAPEGKEVLLISAAAADENAHEAGSFAVGAGYDAPGLMRPPAPPPARRYRDAYERALDDEEVAVAAAVAAEAAAAADSDATGAAAAGSGAAQDAAVSPPPRPAGAASKRRSSHWLSPRDRVAAFRAAHLLPDGSAAPHASAADDDDGAAHAAAGAGHGAIGIWSPFSDGGSEADAGSAVSSSDEDEASAEPSKRHRQHPGDAAASAAPLSPGPELDLDIALSPPAPAALTVEGGGSDAATGADSSHGAAGAPASSAAMEALGSGRVTVRQRRRGRGRALSKRESAVMRLVMQALNEAAALDGHSGAGAGAGVEAGDVAEDIAGLHEEGAPLPAGVSASSSCMPIDEAAAAVMMKANRPGAGLARLDDAASASVSNRSLASLNLGLSNRTIPGAAVSGGVSNRSLASLNLGFSGRTLPGASASLYGSSSLAGSAGSGSASMKGSIVSHGTLASLDLGISNRSVTLPPRRSEDGAAKVGEMHAQESSLTGSKRRRSHSGDAADAAGPQFNHHCSAAAADAPLASDATSAAATAKLQALLSPRSAAAEAASRAWPRVDAALASPMLGAAGASKRKRMLAAEAAADDVAAAPLGGGAAANPVGAHPHATAGHSNSGGAVEAAATGIDSDDSDAPGGYLDDDAPPRKPLHRRSFVLDGSAGPGALLHDVLDEQPAAGSRGGHRPRPSLLPLPTYALSDFVAGRGICEMAKPAGSARATGASAVQSQSTDSDEAAILRAENRRLAAQLEAANAEIARLRQQVAALSHRV